MQRALIVLGLVILATGLAWPWIAKLGLGRLPGDIRIDLGGALGAALVFPPLINVVCP